MNEKLFDILTFQAGYNSAVVLAGTAVLGLGCAVIGFYMMLRGRSMMSDAVSHATLPGIALGFLIALGLGVDNFKNLPMLTLMAFISAFAGMVSVQLISRFTRLAEDAAIGTVLSVFFALGLVLLSHIQNLPVSGKAGLDSFLLGQTAALQKNELYFIAAASAAVIAVTFLNAKEFTALCFDENFCRAQGVNVFLLDTLMSALMIVMVCLGLKTVGAILIIAMLMIPPAAARLWSNRLSVLLPLSGLFGAASGLIGAALSGLAPQLPAGGLIVLVAAILLAFSIFFAPARGVMRKILRRGGAS